ncbi:hypothetical protein D3C73_923520 [compost metagenome]
MSVSELEKDKHLKLIYKNNVVVAKDKDRLIVVHSKRTVKPLLPFEITPEVFDQWKKRDNRLGMTDTPYSELFGSALMSKEILHKVDDFNLIEFIEN